MVSSISKLFVKCLISFNAVFANTTTISILHFNDFHARFEPVNYQSNACNPNEPCIGGFSRLYSAIQQNYAKDVDNKTIYLNAGDNFKGTIWYNLHRWNVTQFFMNKLPLDAMALGNHEFDDGIEGLISFLQTAKAPIIVANINDDNNDPKIGHLFNKSLIVERKGRQIGIIGVLTTTTNLVSNTANLTFQDEIEAINSEAAKLEQMGVFTIIVLSHCGYERDQEIAGRVNSSKISVIVGGHTDTFLYTGAVPPGPDKVQGPYPTVVTRDNLTSPILIVQASAYSKYLGNLSLEYDQEGKLVKWSGNPIFLNESTDDEIDQELALWKQSIDLQAETVIGHSLFKMDNKPCRSSECLLGNFATDAMIFAASYKFCNASTVNLQGFKMADSPDWTMASVALIHAGGLRAGLEQGSIKYKNLVATFPFEDRLYVIETQGKGLLAIFESSVDDNRRNNPHMFQVSGVQVVFNMNNTEGQRVESVRVRCRQCEIPRFESLREDMRYRIVLPGFLLNGGFFPLFKKYATWVHRHSFFDLDVYKSYLEARTPIFQQIENRIIVKS